MTAKQFVRVLRERWKAVVAFLLVGIVASVVAGQLRPVSYTSTFTMLTVAPATQEGQGAYEGELLAQQRTKSYVPMINSERVAERVIRDHQYPATPREISSAITAVSGVDSVVTTVTVRTDSEQGTANLATAVADVFVKFVADFERSSTMGGEPVVNMQIIQPPTPPTAPSSGLVTSLALGFVLGLGLGVGYALLRNALDRSVKTTSTLEALTGAPVVGATTVDENADQSLFVRIAGVDDPTISEDFRQLRIGVSALQTTTGARVVVVTSPTPGDGKTTTVVNLAAAFAAAGGRVLVVDANLRRPRVAERLGVAARPGLTDTLSRNAEPRSMIQRCEPGGIDVLTGGAVAANPGELLGSRSMSALLAELRTSYDLVLVDTPPLLSATDAAAVAPGTDGVLLLCRHGRTTAPQVERALGILQSGAATVLGTLLTMVPRDRTRAWIPYGSDVSATLSPDAPPTEVEAGPAQERIEGARPPTEFADPTEESVEATAEQEPGREAEGLFEPKAAAEAESAAAGPEEMDDEERALRREQPELFQPTLRMKAAEPASSRGSKG
ncbi:polysaccharide biosynthesis tyrosine autokinase [Pseudonocardia xishanensis]|uniref:Polysaccharide biosynthesis tyrosine autokinase n=1 Tax=Pseudonocardia xishanensis TaxID=630995 RepID=A0ABP8S2E7_9PSEU